MLENSAFAFMVKRIAGPTILHVDESYRTIVYVHGYKIDPFN